MRWPWRPKATEDRADYSTQVIGALERAALADASDVAATAAARMAAGFVARAFAMALVTPQDARTAVLTPLTRYNMGAALVLRGEWLGRLDVDASGLNLYPALSWDVHGGERPERWRYSLTHATPDGQVKRTALAAEVIHPRLADESAPWRGVSPFADAGLTSDLAADIERQLAEEAGGTVGRLLHVPGAGADDGTDDSPLNAFKRDLKTLKGRTAIVPSAVDFSEGASAATTRAAFEQQRVGADFPDSVVALRENVTASIVALAGLKSDLFTERADGQALREALRQAVNTGVEPLSRIVEAELSDKLDTGVRLDFRNLWAQDLRTRGQVAKALAEQAETLGLEAADIRRITGF